MKPVLVETSAGATDPDRVATDESQSKSQTRSVESPRRFGVLSPLNSKDTKAILNAVRALGHELVWLRDENITSRIDNGTVHVAPTVGVLINRLLVTKRDQQLEDLELAALYNDRDTTVDACYGA